MLTIDEYNRMKSNSISFVGLGDVVGGKLWYCISHQDTYEVTWFGRKTQCERYIRMHFDGQLKKALLSDLKKFKGRAFVCA